MLPGTPPDGAGDQARALRRRRRRRATAASYITTPPRCPKSRRLDEPGDAHLRGRSHRDRQHDVAVQAQGARAVGGVESGDHELSRSPFAPDRDDQAYRLTLATGGFGVGGRRRSCSRITEFSFGSFVVLAPVLTAVCAFLLRARCGDACCSRSSPRLAATPIPSVPERHAALPRRAGDPAPARGAPPVPQHPFMAPNGSSLLHEDAWQTDASTRAGPLGRDIQVDVDLLRPRLRHRSRSTRRGRIVSVCVGLDRPQAVDPRPADARHDRHARPPAARPVDRQPVPGLRRRRLLLPRRRRPRGRPDHEPARLRDRVPATTLGVERRLRPVRASSPSGRLDHLRAAGLERADLWFASREGVLGTLDRATGAVPLGAARADRQLVRGGGDGGRLRGHRRRAVPLRRRRRRRRRSSAGATPYDNTGETKPGQTQAGSGTTPTLMARGLVAITDNADPMNVVVYTRDGRRGVPRAGVRARARAHRTSR